MGKNVDHTGERHGNLTVIECVGVGKDHHKLWKCFCDCGNITIINSNSLRENGIKSCGCLKGNFSHGLSKTRLYKIWVDMNRRCKSKNRSDYKYYGGKGICVCEKWQKDYTSFANWAQNNGYSDNLTIDRIDNHKGYSPDNCRWVTRKIQASNRSTAKTISFDCQTKSLMEWSKELNINYHTIYGRLAKGWSIEKTFTTKTRQRKNK